MAEGKKAGQRLIVKKNYYVDGNTVKVKETYIKEKEEAAERERRRRKSVRKKSAIRNRQRYMHMDGKRTLLLTACTMLFGAVCGAYVYCQAELTTTMKTVSSLENAVSDLRPENNETSTRLETQINLETIKDIAINQLGMAYPAEENIVYYKPDSANYMNQYEDIEKR